MLTIYARIQNVLLFFCPVLFAFRKFFRNSDPLRLKAYVGSATICSAAVATGKESNILFLALCKDHFLLNRIQILLFFYFYFFELL